MRNTNLALLAMGILERHDGHPSVHLHQLYSSGHSGGVTAQTLSNAGGKLSRELNQSVLERFFGVEVMIGFKAVFDV